MNPYHIQLMYKLLAFSGI